MSILLIILIYLLGVSVVELVYDVPIHLVRSLQPPTWFWLVLGFLVFSWFVSDDN